MKKWLLALVMLLCMGAALADEAPEITGQADFSAENPSVLLDGDLETCWQGSSLEINLDTPCHALYMSFYDTPPHLAVYVQGEDAAWQLACKQPEPFSNACIPLEGATKLRLCDASGADFRISEIHLFGEGDLPGWVQQWQPFTGKADLLVLAAHPDDELLFFGGTIPYYAGEQGKKVIVAYLTTPTNKARINELLDGLWHCGVREYPHLSQLRDVITDSPEAFMEVLGGEEVVQAYLVEMLRRYQPDVAVTHDRQGEYGHAAHVVASRQLRKSAKLAADASYRPELGEAWQTKKIYLHLYRSKQADVEVYMDWNQPLTSFGGKTALDVAKEAFTKHVSQQGVGNYAVRAHGDYDCRRFGLYYSAVGPDAEKNDLFEHITSVEGNVYSK